MISDGLCRMPSGFPTPLPLIIACVDGEAEPAGQLRLKIGGEAGRIG